MKEEKKVKQTGKEHEKQKTEGDLGMDTVLVSFTQGEGTQRNRHRERKVFCLRLNIMHYTHAHTHSRVYTLMHTHTMIVMFGVF